MESDEVLTETEMHSFFETRCIFFFSIITLLSIFCICHAVVNKVVCVCVCVCVCEMVSDMPSITRSELDIAYGPSGK